MESPKGMMGNGTVTISLQKYEYFKGLESEDLRRRDSIERMIKSKRDSFMTDEDKAFGKSLVDSLRSGESTVMIPLSKYRQLVDCENSFNAPLRNDGSRIGDLLTQNDKLCMKVHFLEYRLGFAQNLTPRQFKHWKKTNSQF